MLRKGCQWLRREWKQLLLANLIGMLLQGGLLAAFLFFGCDVFVSVVAAKVASWFYFIVQLIRG